MDLQRLKIEMENGSIEALFELSHEARRKGDLTLLMECFFHFLSVDSPTPETITLIPLFIKPFGVERIRELPNKEKKVCLLTFVKYAQQSKEEFYERESLSFVKAGLRIRNGANSYHGVSELVLKPNRLSGDSLSISSPIELDLLWDTEILYLSLKPLFKSLVHVYGEVCGDKNLLQKSYDLLYSGNLKDALILAERALDFQSKRRKSVINHRNQDKVHPILGKNVDLLGFRRASVACRSFIIALKQDPRVFLPTIIQGISNISSHKLIFNLGKWHDYFLSTLLFGPKDVEPL